MPATEPGATTPPPPTAAPSGPRSWWRWAGLLLPLAAIGAFVLADAVTGRDAPAAIGMPAPDFVLPDTAGGTESLNEALADGRNGVVLYFSMGVGCGGCFAQIPEVADELAARGFRLVSVMVDEADITRVEAERYGATSPVALDTDRSVSDAYGMLGAYGHGDRPSHSFALITPDATVADVRHYAEMFVPVERLLTDLDLTALDPTAG